MTSHSPTELQKKAGAKPVATVLEAKAQKNPYVCLSSIKLTQVPIGLSELQHVTNLDLSNNSIASIPEDCLPKGLVELTITGCQLTALPASLAKLSRLEKLFAGANRLALIEPVFCCPRLQHAGLAYNSVAVLPPPEVLRGSGLLSLDLAHNDLEGLATTLGALAALPSLAGLSLVGNPLALHPHYTAEVKGRLRQIMFLDGQRLDLPANSRPGTAQSAVSRPASGATAPHVPDRDRLSSIGTATSTALRGASPGTNTRPSLQHTQTVHFVGSEASHDGWEGGAGSAEVELELTRLEQAEDPFAAMTARWAEQIAAAEAAGATVPPVLDYLVPPLQPVYYHVEVHDHEGTPLACIPIKVPPPAPPDVLVMFDPKLKAAAAKEAAAREAAAKKAAKPPSAQRPRSKGKPGADAREGAATPSEPRPLETGRLRVLLPLRPVLGHRNWLRSGTSVTMYKTALLATPRPPAPPADDELGPPPGAEASKRAATPPRTPGSPSRQATRGAKKKIEEAPPVEYDISGTPAVLGTALLRAGSELVDAAGAGSGGGGGAIAPLVASQRLEFRPPPALFDERGIRLALKDPRHPTQVVGTMEARLTLLGLER